MYILRHENQDANDLARQSSGYIEITVEVIQQDSTIVANLDLVDSWKRMLMHYLQNPSAGTNFKIQQALNYVLVGDEMYKKRTTGVLLQCLNRKDTYKVMVQVHEGICGCYRSKLS